MNAASDTALVLHVHYTFVWGAISDYCFPRGYAPNTCREKVMMSDGGHICLDWYNIQSKDQPTVLFLPGITGMVWCGICGPHICAIFPI